MDKEQYKREHAVKIANGIIKTASEIVNIMKKDKGPAFTLSELTITETKTGITGTVKQDGNGYSVIITDARNLSDTKKHALAKRMRNWYYYNYVQNK